MATFGQGINPQLGAIDYSPILRGSMAGAQMAAQGSQMIGQGLANLGQEVGRGIEKEKERNRVLKEQQFKNKQERDMMAAKVKQGTKFANAIGALEKLPEGVAQFFKTYATDIADNPNLSLAEQGAAAAAFMDQAPTIITLGLNESKRIKDIQQNEFLKQAILLNIEADTGKIDLPGTYETAINFGADPTYAMKSLNSFAALTPETPYTPNIIPLVDPFTGNPVSVLQTGKNSSEVLEPKPEPKVPASILRDESKIKQISKARELYRNGNEGKALDILIGLGIRNSIGGTPSIEDLPSYFKDPDTSFENPVVNRFTVFIEK